MIILLTTVHVIVCLFQVVVVLLQSGKAADLAGAFGGMGSQTVFGPRGSATVLSKATTIAEALFMVTSLSLSLISSRVGSSSSILDKAKKAPANQKQGAPAAKPGDVVPINVQTEVGGQKSAPSTIQVPVQTLPPGQAAPKMPQQDKKKQ